MTILHTPGGEELRCQMGVGDGSGQLFVYGTAEAIGAAREIVWERDELRRKYREAKEAIESLRGTRDFWISEFRETLRQTELVLDFLVAGKHVTPELIEGCRALARVSGPKK